MGTSISIGLTSCPAGTTTAIGPGTLNGEQEGFITILRTVTGGLDSLLPANWLKLELYVAVDAYTYKLGGSWILVAAGGQGSSILQVTGLPAGSVNGALLATPTGPTPVTVAIQGTVILN